ncbi:MAG: rRNA maturation RNase YbeY [Nitrospirae bacterium]|nr:rRNA maturation RNase YbeY [Nitrospirota bacterium]
MASKVLQDFKLTEPDLSIVLVNDRKIRELNRRYRNMDKATDVLAFAMQDGAGQGLHPWCLGDVVISVEYASRQAREKEHTQLRELSILLIHGILHLLGYDHEKSSQEAARMRKKERMLLKRIAT